MEVERVDMCAERFVKDGADFERLDDDVVDLATHFVGCNALPDDDDIDEGLLAQNDP